MVRKPCCSFVGMNRGPWTADEDLRLTNYIQIHGVGNWRTLPTKAGLLRCGKGCRLRWMNYLRPDVKRGHISPDEEDIIIRLHKLVGNRWSLIAGRIPGRTDNEIKNYWNTHLRKKFATNKTEPLHKQPGFRDENGSAFSHIYGIASTLFGTSEIYNEKGYRKLIEPIESFKHKFNGSDNLRAINGFGSVLNTVGNVSWPYHNLQFSSMAMPSNFGVASSSITGTLAGDDSTADRFLTQNVTHFENLPWSESNMQLHDPMLTAEHNTQFTSCRPEITDVVTVDCENMGEAMTGKAMVVDSNIVTGQFCESLSALSDWYYPQSGSSFHEEGYCL